MNRIFTREARDNGFRTIFDYIRQKPITSIQQLLPAHFNYLLDSNHQELAYPIGYPINVFLEELHKNFRKASRAVRISNIWADNGLSDTPLSYVTKASGQLPKWEHGEPVETFFDAGDSTVLRASIENIVGYADKGFEGVDHTIIASTSAPYLFSELNNKLPTSIVGKNYNPIKDADYGVLLSKIAPSPSDLSAFAEVLSNFIKKHPGHTALFLTLFSPIDMQIVAPDGKRLGKDFATGASINEISGAIYSGPTDQHEYALILDPLPGAYKVETMGTGSGTYTIATAFATESTSTISAVAGTTTLAQLTSNQVSISGTSVQIKKVDEPALVPTPDTCVTDMNAAYAKKWITKKAVLDGLVLDCKALKTLFKTRDNLTAIAKLSLAQKALLAATNLAIKVALEHMDLLAKDKSNTKDAVELIYKYTTWFRKGF